MLIGVDWGTSRLRAALVADDGAALARTESGAGLLNIADGDFEGALDAAIATLGEAAMSLPVLMSGMVGSRKGWREVPYVKAPASLDALAEGVVTVETQSRTVAIVPGVADDPGHALGGEVMRGEEVEVFGALELLGVSEARLVLPGTHSKWVTVSDGSISAWSTFLTGDAYAALSRHTILAQTVGEPTDEEAFLAAVELMGDADQPGNLLGELFKARTGHLFGHLDDDGAASTLSGLLIGAEVLTAATYDSVTILVGDGALADWYELALSFYDLPAHRAPRDCALRGLSAVAARRGLITPLPPPAMDPALQRANADVSAWRERSRAAEPAAGHGVELSHVNALWGQRGFVLRLRDALRGRIA